MANLNFYLEKRRDKVSGEIITQNVPIFLDFSFEGKRLQHYTGLRIDANKWDDGMMRTKDGMVSRIRNHPGKAKRNVTGAGEINEALNRIIARVNEISRTAEALKIPLTVEYIRNELKNDPTKKRGMNVLEAFQQFIDEKTTRDSVGTIKSNKTCLRHFKDFCGNRTNFEFHDVTVAFFERFKAYLINEVGHTHNTVIKYTKTFRAFMRWATEREYNHNMDFNKFNIEAEKEPAIIYLTWDELMHLYNLKVTNVTLANVRDVFCFGCFTGQRYSDVENLKPEHIVNDIWVNAPIKSHNSRPLYIPLNKYAKAILNKYKNLPTGKALPVISNQKMNFYLKELGKLAKLFNPVTIYRFKGGRRIEKTYKKCDVLTTHIMRKTFVTNALSLGMQAATIKEFTGHKSEKNFNRYLDIITEDKIKAMELFDKKATKGKGKKSAVRNGK
jgi:integrase